MAALTAKLGSVGSLSGLVQLRTSTQSSRVSIQCRRQLACRAQDGESSKDDKSAYPQAAAPSSPGLYTGYIKKDSAGIAVIDVVEPAVYVAKPGADESAPPTTAGIAIIFLGAAAAALAILSNNAPQLGAELSLSQYVDKFSTEISVGPAAASPVSVAEKIAPFESTAPSLATEVSAETDEIDSPVVVEAVEVFEILEDTEPPVVIEPVAVFEILEDTEPPLEVDAVTVFEIVPAAAESTPEQEPKEAVSTVEDSVAEAVTEAV